LDRLTALDSGDKGGMIALGLVRIGLSEGSKRTIKHIASPQVATDLGGVSGTGMSTSKSPSTEPTILNKAFWYQGLEVH
jgi:hypothetical protein